MSRGGAGALDTQPCSAFNLPGSHAPAATGVPDARSAARSPFRHIDLHQICRRHECAYRPTGVAVRGDADRAVTGRAGTRGLRFRGIRGHLLGLPDRRAPLASDRPSRPRREFPFPRLRRLRGHHRSRRGVVPEPARRCTALARPVQGLQRHERPDGRSGLDRAGAASHLDGATGAHSSGK